MTRIGLLVIALFLATGGCTHHVQTPAAEREKLEWLLARDRDGTRPLQEKDRLKFEARLAELNREERGAVVVVKTNGGTRVVRADQEKAAREGLRAAQEGLRAAREGLKAAEAGLRAAREGGNAEAIRAAEQGVIVSRQGVALAEQGVKLAEQSVAMAGHGNPAGGSAQEGDAPPAAAAPDPILVLRRGMADEVPSGLYAKDEDSTFNVLDGAVLDEERGTIALYGHRDERFTGPRIYWLHHLAELLDRPDPEFSLDWTPDSEARVDRFLQASETPEEVRRVAEQWGDIIDERSGTVSAIGRLLLPAMHLNFTDNGGAPGMAGMHVTDEADGIRIDTVWRGSPAERADLRVGDTITDLGGPSAIDGVHLIHAIRWAGEGSTMTLTIRRNGGAKERHTLVVGAYKGDNWEGVSSNEVAARIFRAAGMTEAGGVTYFGEVITRVQHTSRHQDAVLGLVGVLGLGNDWVELVGKVNNDEMTSDAAATELSRRVARGMDRAFRLDGGPVSGAFEKEYQRTGDMEQALGAAFGELDRRRKAALGEALRILWQRPEGVRIPPELVELTWGLHAQVQPDYRGVDPSSQLARVLFEADYVGKRLINTPELAGRVPGYVTLFEFDQAHPGMRAGAGKPTTFRMWISVASVDAVQSKDGSTLETRGAGMQFNIREKDERGADKPPVPGGYESLLTSLYAPLSREFPALHELQECAKLAAVARWAKAKKPDLALPREGRAAWNGPATMPGLTWVVLHPPKGAERFDETVIATGGASIRLPLTPFSEDSSVVDLRDKTGIVTFETDLRDAVADSPQIRLKRDVPPPSVISQELYVPAVRANQVWLSVNLNSLKVYDKDRYDERRRKDEELLSVIEDLKTTRELLEDKLNPGEKDILKARILRYVDAAQAQIHEVESRSSEPSRLSARWSQLMDDLRKSKATLAEALDAGNWGSAMFDAEKAEKFRNAGHGLVTPIQSFVADLPQTLKEDRDALDREYREKAEKWLKAREKDAQQLLARMTEQLEILDARLSGDPNAKALLKKRFDDKVNRRDQLLHELDLVAPASSK